ncbi:MAG: ATP synthase F1 subunit delta [Candidatus Eisenbacteria bacterium]|nr:ATP synthase F1 subunit delta [Candidatus Eisenbacteria bacterium]
MSEAAIARRYARALFDAADRRGMLDRIAEELESVAELIHQHPRLGGLLRAPQVGAREKRALLERLFAERVHPIMAELLDLLLEKKRFALLPEIRLAHRELVAQLRGVQRTEIITAVPLTAALTGRLQQVLAAMTDKQVALEPRIDPEILGGVIVRMGDCVIDGSVRRRLQEMRRRMLAAEVHGRERPTT